MELEQPVEETPRDRFQYVVIVLSLLATILGTGVALLQRHASVNESRASRATVALAIQVMGELQRRGQQAAYDVGLTADYAAISMDAIALQGTALYSLSLIIRNRLRYLFALVGSGVVGLALLWVLWTLVMV